MTGRKTARIRVYKQCWKERKISERKTVVRPQADKIQREKRKHLETIINGVERKNNKTSRGNRRRTKKNRERYY